MLLKLRVIDLTDGLMLERHLDGVEKGRNLFTRIVRMIGCMLKILCSSK